MAEEVDQKPFTALTEKAREHYGELVAMDRSIGTLRKGLRDLGIEKETLVWFSSDKRWASRLQAQHYGRVA